ncbi:unnamed protein product [Protopolystoma xenopodis]|uniref:Uncharacterized protein n=1 Tax=Protopolystoma xenopodis TaxID=117903 RepID=A0A3S5B0Q9_9PLAT|nr:unnamed protein product [Protopolystoma xenopodis]
MTSFLTTLASPNNLEKVEPTEEGKHENEDNCAISADIVTVTKDPMINDSSASDSCIMQAGDCSATSFNSQAVTSQDHSFFNSAISVRTSACSAPHPSTDSIISVAAGPSCSSSPRVWAERPTENKALIGDGDILTSMEAQSPSTGESESNSPSKSQDVLKHFEEGVSPFLLRLLPLFVNLKYQIKIYLIQLTICSMSLFRKAYLVQLYISPVYLFLIVFTIQASHIFLRTFIPFLAEFVS